MHKKQLEYLGYTIDSGSQYNEMYYKISWGMRYMKSNRTNTKENEVMMIVESINTYKKFKGMDGEDIVENRVKTVLKSKISEVTTDYSMMDIYSGNRAQLNEAITDYLNKDFSQKYGIEVLDASIIDVHPDKKLKKAIDNRVTALQEKQQAQAEQEKVKVQKQTEQLQAEADANIEITKAQADAEKTKIKAEADAEKTRIAAEAQAKANKELSSSITDELIRMKEAEAHYKNGWVTVQGTGTTVVDATEK